MSTQLKFESSIQSIDGTLSSATTPGLSGLRSDSSERVLHIPESSSITEASPLDYLVSYPGHTLRVRVLTLCRDAVGVFCSTNRVGQFNYKTALKPCK